jgi:hypothetical protein
VRLIGNPNLTGERRIAVAGMASFSNEGPLGACCSDCLFLDKASKRRFKTGAKAKCLKFSQLMQGRAGPSFPVGMAACKFFEASPQLAKATAWPGAPMRSNQERSEDTRVKTKDMYGSAFLKPEDIPTPVVKTIVGAAMGKFGKINLEFDDETMLGLNASNWKRLNRAWGDETSSWIDKRVKLSAGTAPYNGDDLPSVILEPILAPPAVKLPGPNAIDDISDDIPF